MAVQSTPPPQVVFETTDCDQAAEYLTRVYGTGIRLTGRTHGYRYRHTRIATETFSIDTGTHTDDVALTVEPAPVVCITLSRDTIVDCRAEGVEQRFGPGELFLTNSVDNSPIRTRWRHGSLLGVPLPVALLDQVAGTAETSIPIRFTDLKPIDPAAARRLTALIDYLAKALRDQPEIMTEPLVARTSGRLLAATVLSTFPNTALIAPTIEDRRDGHPRNLRRAIAFIDDHAHLDISVADIAAAVGVTVRTLQYAFRRHRGITPTGYLRRVRLRQAHQELLAADPTTGITVTEIAARWGFFHSGRFAHYYRCTYGRPPHETLVRSGPRP